MEVWAHVYIVKHNPNDPCYYDSTDQQPFHLQSGHSLSNSLLTRPAAICSTKLGQSGVVAIDLFQSFSQDATLLWKNIPFKHDHWSRPPIRRNDWFPFPLYLLLHRLPPFLYDLEDNHQVTLLMPSCQSKTIGQGGSVITVYQFRRDDESFAPLSL